MSINTKFRSNLPEIMDDFDMKGEDLIKNLDEIAKINQFLGGNSITLQGVNQLIDKITNHNEITIIDIGCGNGDMLRKLAEQAQKNNLKFKLIGIDANSATIRHAESLSENYDNIVYQCINVFDDAFLKLKYDIALCTLTLHHFKSFEIDNLLTILYKNVSIGIVINDLERTIIAYRLFQMLGFVFRMNKISRVDGLISILRGFKRNELIDISEKLSFKKYTIRWKWAFRYQLIISKI
jgi:2-polyprenyl-3-methyl-5-hydroxy-6-metoxy-1,4-benzoquinol methylase